jgi:flagellar secretion chaperone FliS
MIQRNNPWQSYRKVATQTASPGQLVLMLYEGAISFLEKGLTGFEHTDPLEFNQTISNNVLRAQAIIFEMNSRLDMKQGGEIADNFRRLYNYFYRRLQEANVKKQKAPIVEVIMRLRELRDSWAEMLQRGPIADVVANSTADVSLQAA